MLKNACYEFTLLLQSIQFCNMWAQENGEAWIDKPFVQAAGNGVDRDVTLRIACVVITSVNANHVK